MFLCLLKSSIKTLTEEIQILILEFNLKKILALLGAAFSRCSFLADYSKNITEKVCQTGNKIRWTGDVCSK